RVDKNIIQDILRERVRDGVVRRLIGKWLNAGIQEDGRTYCAEAGVPQGGVISPLLSNIYLHEVLDKWFVELLLPRMRGRAFMVRFADDAILAFEYQDDAEKVYRVLPKRLKRFGLALHTGKTRLIDFRRKPKNGPIFNFLGFTHFWSKSRYGKLVIKCRTSKESFAKSLRKVYQWMRIACHWKVTKQYRILCMKLRGHYQYYGITGNSRALSRFSRAVVLIWFKWLKRRSRKSKRNWQWYLNLLNRLKLPKPICVHSTLRRAANL
ncbi:MAG TPA: group II intron reverse transcriptase/maturase, partial [Chromatiaceae bacterium]|nr:group II intron reverse transcriptase/maturase [Chromatiaceae bacterium]